MSEKGKYDENNRYNLTRRKFLSNEWRNNEKIKKKDENLT